MAASSPGARLYQGACAVCHEVGGAPLFGSRPSLALNSNLHSAVPDNLIQPAAEMVLAPLREDAPSNLIIDLAGVRYFGSAFITFLLRCHLLVKNRGSELVLAGVNPQIRELLRTTALDTLWALYDTANEAVEALGGVD